MDVGFWAIVPPLLTIVLAIITKEVLLSLFIGVYTGCLIIMSWQPLPALEKMMEIIVAKLTDPWNMQVLTYRYSSWRHDRPSDQIRRIDGFRQSSRTQDPYKERRPGHDLAARHPDILR